MRLLAKRLIRGTGLRGETLSSTSGLRTGRKDSSSNGDLGWRGRRCVGMESVLKRIFFNADVLREKEVFGGGTGRGWCAILMYGSIGRRGRQNTPSNMSDAQLIGVAMLVAVAVQRSFFGVTNGAFNISGRRTRNRMKHCALIHYPKGRCSCCCYDYRAHLHLSMVTLKSPTARFMT